ncbi:MAG: hypothetical protein IPJ65_31570 [Archangiaceae bacterium]|nr:hypothetical protein [Archangiaceae bacterium]
MLSDHLDAVTLERSLLRDLSDELAHQTDAHLSSCLPCRRQLDALARERAAFLTELPFDTLLPQLPPRPAPSRWRTAARAGLALAAAVVALVVSARLAWAPAEPVRLKGVGLSLFRSRAGAVKLLTAEDRLAAGDALRLSVTVDASGRWMAWAVDGSGRVDRMLEQPLQLEQGAVTLPGAVVVEAPCLRTWFIAAKLDGPLERYEAELGEAARSGALERPPARPHQGVIDAWCE